MKTRIIRWHELKERIGGVSHVTVWRWERDGQFPKRVRLGGNNAGWLEPEIEQWIEQRAAERPIDRPTIERE